MCEDVATTDPFSTFPSYGLPSLVSHWIPASTTSSKFSALGPDLEALDQDVEWVSMTEVNEQVLGVEKCEVCGLTFNSRMLLQNHNEEYPLCCRECGVCYTTLYEVNQHDLETDHKEGD